MIEKLFVDKIICDECSSDAEYTIHTSFDILNLCEDCAIDYVMDNYIFENSKIVKMNELCPKCGGGNRIHYIFYEDYKEENEIEYDEICQDCACKYGKKEVKNFATRI